MAVAPDRWGRQVSAAAEKLGTIVDQFPRKVVLDLARGVIFMMPVLTGHARWNTRVSFNTLPNEEIDGVDPGGAATVAEATAMVEAPKSASGLWYVYNAVPYIRPLEFAGHSQQAPQGMFRVTIARVQDSVAAAGIELQAQIDREIGRAAAT